MKEGELRKAVNEYVSLVGKMRDLKARKEELSESLQKTGKEVMKGTNAQVVRVEFPRRVPPSKEKIVAKVGEAWWNRNSGKAWSIRLNIQVKG